MLVLEQFSNLAGFKIYLKYIKWGTILSIIKTEIVNWSNIWNLELKQDL